MLTLDSLFLVQEHIILGFDVHHLIFQRDKLILFILELIQLFLQRCDHCVLLH